MSAAPWLVVVLLVLFLFWREHRHDQERRELYTRLMARSLEEYINLTDRSNKLSPKSYNPIRDNIARFRERQAKEKISEVQEAGE